MISTDCKVCWGNAFQLLVVLGVVVGVVVIISMASCIGRVIFFPGAFICPNEKERVYGDSAIFPQKTGIYLFPQKNGIYLFITRLYFRPKVGK